MNEFKPGDQLIANMEFPSISPGWANTIFEFISFQKFAGVQIKILAAPATGFLKDQIILFPNKAVKKRVLTTELEIEENKWWKFFNE